MMTLLSEQSETDRQVIIETIALETARFSDSVMLEASRFCFPQEPYVGTARDTSWHSCCWHRASISQCTSLVGWLPRAAAETCAEAEMKNFSEPDTKVLPIVKSVTKNCT
jgi:hypothetical protein